MMKRHRALLMSVEALVITREQGPSFLPYFFCLCSLAALSWPLAFSAFPYVSLSFFLFFFFFSRLSAVFSVFCLLFLSYLEVYVLGFADSFGEYDGPVAEMDAKTLCSSIANG